MTEIPDDFDRVTDIISAFSGIDRIPYDILQKAADRGTRVHHAIESFFNPLGMVELDEETEGYFESFQRFWEERGEQFKGNLQIEKRLYCDQYKITGQCDLIAETHEGINIIDWKTSSKEQSKSWALQGAAYRWMLKKHHPNASDVIFVRLKKDGKKPSIHKYENYSDCWGMFLECLNIYRHFEMKKWRKNED